MNPIKLLIAQGKLNRAVAELIEKATGSLENEVIQLQFKLNVLERDERMGVLSFEQVTRERAKITSAVMDLIDLVDQSPVNPPSPELPKPSPVNPSASKVYISYGWEEKSEAIVSELQKVLQEKGIDIVRDVNNLGYRGSIKGFMEDMGKGNKVILIISKKYLESDNCMFELVQVYQNENFRARIFPIILSGAGIYSPVSRARYINFWDAKIEELDTVIKSIKTGVNISNLQQELDNYAKIRASFDNLAFVLKDMNALNPEIHKNEHFDSLYQALIGS